MPGSSHRRGAVGRGRSCPPRGTILRADGRRARARARPRAAGRGDRRPRPAVRGGRPRRAFAPTPPTWMRRAGGKPIRLASKSVRCRALQERVLATPASAGMLAFTLPEALWLAGHGVRRHPRRLPDRRPRRAARAGRATPSRRGAITVMVDSVAQLDLVEAAAGGRARRCASAIDVDAGWRALGGRLRVGVTPLAGAHAGGGRRAGARDRRPARPAAGRAHGLRGADRRARRRARPAGRAGRGAARRAARIARASSRRAGRAAVVAAVRAVAPLEFVNGGGTGSARAHRRRGRGHRGRGRVGAVRADAVRRLPRLPPAARRRCSRCRSCAGPARGGSTVAGRRLPRLRRGRAATACRGRPARRACASTRSEGAGEVQTPLARRRRRRPRSATASGSATPRRASCASASTQLHLLQGDRVVGDRADLPRRGCVLPVADLAPYM